MNAENQESNITVCKVCNLPKVKIVAGKYPKGKTKKYVDELGGHWNGKICAVCNRARVRKVMQASRMPDEES